MQSYIIRLLTLLAFNIFFVDALFAKLVTFGWQEVSGAASYVLQISDTASFNKIILNSQPKTNQGTLDLPLGVSYYRVRAIDYAGTPGKWTNHEKIIVNPSRPKYISPDGKNISSPPNTLLNVSWHKEESKIDPIVRWTVSVNNQKSDVTSPIYAFKATKTGKFTVTVQAITQNGLKSDPSLPLDINVETSDFSLSKPKNQETVSNNNVVFQWKQLSSTSQYTLYIFKDKTMKDLFKKNSITKNQDTIGFIPNGHYFWYVEGVDTKTKKKVTSNVQTFEVIQSVFF